MGSRLIFKDPFVKAASWYHFTAEKATVGALSAHVARILCGKHKPVYNPSVDCGDNIVISNCEKVVFTGKKFDQKHYRWHTGYVGNLVEYPVRRMFERHPQRVLWKAVYGMLPKNRLRRLRMQRLRLFVGEKHPFDHLLAPLPEHLKFVPKVDPEPTEEELMHRPGYWVEFFNDAEGVQIKTTVQQEELIPKRIRGGGLFKKGVAADRAEIKPIDQIEWLREVATLGDSVQAAKKPDIAAPSSGKK